MRQTIKILTKNSPKWCLIEAEIINGILAIHESMYNYEKRFKTKRYNVTVIPSGMYIFTSESYEKCVGFAKEASRLNWEPVKIMMRDIGMHCYGGYCIDQACGFDFEKLRKISYIWSC